MLELTVYLSHRKSEQYSLHSINAVVEVFRGLYHAYNDKIIDYEVFYRDPVWGDEENCTDRFITAYEAKYGEIK